MPAPGRKGEEGRVREAVSEGGREGSQYERSKGRVRGRKGG